MRLIGEISHVALVVPDLDRSLTHATSVLRLRELERTEDAVVLGVGGGDHDLQLIAGNETALDHVGLRATGADTIEALYARLVREGAPIVSQDDGATGSAPAIRFIAPGPHAIEVHLAGPTAAAAREVDPIRPRRLGHVTLYAPDRLELEQFLERVLGFIPSDRVGERLVWMRCNADHHGIAVGGALTAGLNHLAWEMTDGGGLSTVADHLAAHETTLEWGPGRHGPGDNLAIYHRDPANAMHEHYAELRQIYDDDWRGDDWEQVPNWRNLWGPDQPEAFAGVFPPARPFEGSER